MTIFALPANPNISFEAPARIASESRGLQTLALAPKIAVPYLITAEHLAAIAGRATPLMPGLAEWLNATCPLSDRHAAGVLPLPGPE